MTTATSPIPARYDFDEHFAPLPRLDQNGRPSCMLETRATLVNAFARMRLGLRPVFDDRSLAAQWPQDPRDPCDYLVNAGSAQLRIRNYTGCGDVAYWPGASTTPPGSIGAPTPDALKRALALNGVLGVVVPAYCKPFAKAWKTGRPGHWRMPVLHPGDGPAGLNHGITAVGYTKAGVIVLNSWPRWGYRQRVILGWDFIDHYRVLFTVYTFAIVGGPDYPVDSLVLPPKR